MLYLAESADDVLFDLCTWLSSVGTVVCDFGCPVPYV